MVESWRPQRSNRVPVACPCGPKVRVPNPGWALAPWLFYLQIWGWGEESNSRWAGGGPAACTHKPARFPFPLPGCGRNSTEAQVCRHWHQLRFPVPSGSLPTLPGLTSFLAGPQHGLFVAGSQAWPTGLPASSHPLLGRPAGQARRQAGRGQTRSLFCTQHAALQTPVAGAGHGREGITMELGVGRWRWGDQLGSRRSDGLQANWGAAHPLPARG